jgi:hypothetical protein
MTDKPHTELTDTGRELAAVAHHMDDVVTGAIKTARQEGRDEERERSWQNERQHTGLTPAPIVTHSDVKLAIAERCESCQRPGGAIHDLADEVKGLAAEVKAAVLTMAGKQGETRVWKIVGGAAWAIALIVMTYTLNHYSAKRTEDTAKTQAKVAEVVAQKLEKIEEVAKAMAPEPLYSPAKESK